MSRFTLVGYDGKILEIVESATWMEAERAARARGLRVHVAMPYRPERDSLDVPRGTDAGAALAEAAEDRLTEAFRRLGLSESEAGHALRGRRGDVLTESREEDPDARLAEALGRLGLSEREAIAGAVGRDGTPMERHRRAEALTEAFGDVGDKTNASVGDNAPPGAGHWRRQGRGWSRGARVGTGAERAAAADRMAAAKPKLLSQVATEAEIAGTLIRAGYDADAVATYLGLPVRHTGRLPVTVQAPTTPKSSAEPVAAAEAARFDAGARSESVPLVEDRIGAALGRAFSLTEAETKQAGKGR